mmetsp:Transcript_94393/g.243773  ORF Transcript_94393/g.243773 Transcript_94393/m.243773 type:complete len:326 (-) Transcript_94393:43-1020(-)
MLDAVEHVHGHVLARHGTGRPSLRCLLGGQGADGPQAQHDAVGGEAEEHVLVHQCLGALHPVEKCVVVGTGDCGEGLANLPVLLVQLALVENHFGFPIPRHSVIIPVHRGRHQGGVEVHGPKLNRGVQACALVPEDDTCMIQACHTSQVANRLLHQGRHHVEHINLVVLLCVRQVRRRLNPVHPRVELMTRLGRVEHLRLGNGGQRRRAYHLGNLGHVHRWHASQYVGSVCEGARSPLPIRRQANDIACASGRGRRVPDAPRRHCGNGECRAPEESHLSDQRPPAGCLGGRILLDFAKLTLVCAQGCEFCLVLNRSHFLATRARR